MTIVYIIVNPNYSGLGAVVSVHSTAELAVNELTKHQESGDRDFTVAKMEVDKKDEPQE